jgi:hypothetical protein
MILITTRGEMIQDPCCIGYYADSEPLACNPIIISAIPKGCNQRVIVGRVHSDTAAVDAIRRYAATVKRGSRDIIYWSDLI